MSVRAVAAAVVAGAAVAIVTPASAAAHPFGPPPTATIDAEGTVITVDWTATPDDAVAIGEELGVMPPGSVAAYRQDAAAQVAPSAADEAALSASPQLREYLRRNIVAVQDAQPCEPVVPPIDDFVHSGARVELRCRADVGSVGLRITMLHDIHPAYRTLAVVDGARPSEAVFTTSAPEHEFHFGGGGTGTRATLPVAVAAGAAAGAASSIVIILWRRSGRRRRG